MGRPVADGAILEVTYDQSMDSSLLLNIFHYRLIATPSVSVDGDDVVDILNTALNIGLGSVPNLLKAKMADTWSFTAFRTQWISPTRYTPVQYVNGIGA